MTKKFYTRASRKQRFNYSLEKACRQVFPQIYFGLSKDDLTKLQNKLQSKNQLPFDSKDSK